MTDWDTIEKRLKVDQPALNVAALSTSHIQTLLNASRIRFNANGKNPLVQGLKRFIMADAHASIDDVLSWYIEPSDHAEKAFLVRLRDGKRYIGVLHPSGIEGLEGRWVCREFKVVQ